MTNTELRGISDHLLALNSVLFFQAIDYFSFYSAYWQYHSVLGALFAGAEVGIITKYVRRFEIKRRPNNYNNDQLFVESFLANHPKGDISAILFCGMYNKWSQWLDKAVEDGTYVQGLVFTNCFSYVVQYSLQRESSLEGFIFELGLCLRNLKKVEYGWFKDEIQQRTAFFASLTRLYLVIVECHFKEINAKLPSAIVEELLATLDDRRLWLRYFDAIEQPHTFMKIRELIR